MLSGETTIRVRYAETDRMGLLHHANYLIYFEQARTDLLRTLGGNYKELEDRGYFLVVSKIEVRYKRPAHYDDELTAKFRHNCEGVLSAAQTESLADALWNLDTVKDFGAVMRLCGPSTPAAAAAARPVSQAAHAK